MTLTEFKSLSDSIKDDAEFLAHPEVRRVYWQVVEPGKVFRHDRVPGMPMCRKCKKEIFYPSGIPTPEFSCHCEYPDHIPGSLADAVEVMRAKVAERWETNSERGSFLCDICNN